ncbi:hypothetical protein [Rheinheimera soli]|uniref:Zinc ribbon domain-containing protein n=1 Tax=Rheinheimera soli TaxID=443616 RepID=A0ABU1VVI5_9GAMM|nr:hypothetical protein [Rheinheimera soli]MDR7119717.1 hypothetical protein [Rheinheimera soli]
MSDGFLLRDTRSNTGSNASFWAYAGGYTTNLRDAEVFDREIALRQHNSRETDLPVPVELAFPNGRQRVDMQMLGSVEVVDGEFYVLVVQGEYDGNDCLFVGEKGNSYNLNQAIRLEAEAACQRCTKQSNLRPYHAGEMEHIARLTIAAELVRPDICAKVGGFKLKKPQRITKPTYRCHGCGRFITELQNYTTCPHCEAENRP